MKQMKDDEIEVLGASGKERFNRKWWIVLLIGILCIVFIGYFMYNKEEEAQEEIAEIIQDEESESIIAEQSEEVLRTDSINDVALNIYALQNLRAGLVLQLPSPEDTTIYSWREENEKQVIALSWMER